MTLNELNKLREKTGIKNLLTQNAKIKKTSQVTGKRVYNFNIPAYRGLNNEIICPFAGSCKTFCYARKGNYAYNSTQMYSQYRYELSKFPSKFRQDINSEIEDKRVEYLRVHDSGDYYSLDYMKLWFQIANDNPNVVFYSYTKSHQMVRLAQRLGIVPDNYVFIFSFGSIQDNLINTDTERHAKIFDTREHLIADGYHDASEIDLNAIDSVSHKIGLVIH